MEEVDVQWAKRCLLFEHQRPPCRAFPQSAWIGWWSLASQAPSAPSAIVWPPGSSMLLCTAQVC